MLSTENSTQSKPGVGFPKPDLQIFGREKDIRYLVSRAAQPGLTAIFSRPLMGKTSTLNNFAIELQQTDNYLIGYHECMGGDSSPLLYAVQDLYQNWLLNSSFREQAIKLWRQHNKGLPQRLAIFVTELVSKLSGVQFAKDVIDAVSGAFNGLYKIQNDVFSGGLNLAPQPYVEMRTLINQVANISQQKIVLIIDAWDKNITPSSSGINRIDSNILEAFVKNIAEWPNIHIFLAVRSPDKDSTQFNNEAFLRAKDIADRPGITDLYKLYPLDLNDKRIRKDILTYIHNNMPTSQNLSDDFLIQSIDGYPAVISYWSTEDIKGLQSEDDFKRVAQNAHNIRYPDLQHRLNALSKEEKAIAARLAALPRLTDSRWNVLKSNILGDSDEEILDEMFDNGVFSKGTFPSYGHDTRHDAVRFWFIEHKSIMFERNMDNIIESIASSIEGISRENRIYCETISACHELSSLVTDNSFTHFLIDAARLMTGEADDVIENEFISAYKSFTEKHPSYTCFISKILFQIGKTKFEKEEYKSALTNFDTVINLPGAADDAIARSYLRHGMYKQINEKFEDSIKDLTSALEFKTIPSFITAQILNARGRSKIFLNDYDSAMADFSTSSELPDLSASQQAYSLIHRCILNAKINEWNAVLRDADVITKVPGLPDGMLISVISARSLAKAHIGDLDGLKADVESIKEVSKAGPEMVFETLNDISQLLTKSNLHEAALLPLTESTNIDGIEHESFAYALTKIVDLHVDAESYEQAIETLTKLIELPNISAKQAAETLLLRGQLNEKLGNVEDHHSDLSKIIKMNDAPVDLVIGALIDRGYIKGKRGDRQGEIADYTAVINLQGVQAEDLSLAFYNRGVAFAINEQPEKALQDYTNVIDMADAPVKWQALCLFNRGFEKGLIGDTEGKLIDLTQLIEWQEAPDREVSIALVGRAEHKKDNNDNEGALRDYLAILDLKDAENEQLAIANYEVGLLYYHNDEISKAIEFYTNVISMISAPDRITAKAYFERGAIKQFRDKDFEAAIKDYTAVSKLPNPPNEVLAKALINRGNLCKGEEAKNDYNTVIALTDIPVDFTALALTNLGKLHKEEKKYQTAIEYCTRAIQFEGISKERLAKALVDRSDAYLEHGLYEQALNDIQSVLNNEDTPGDYIALAINNRGEVKLKQGDPDGALVDFISASEIPNLHPEISDIITNNINSINETLAESEK